MNFFRSFRRPFYPLLFVLAFNGSALAGDFFNAGIAAFASGQFADAEKDFRAEGERHPAAGTFVNLGLAEWRRGRTGAAILSWEQALWIDPSDARARANLRYARQSTGLEPPGYSWYERVSTWLPANVWTEIACGSFWMAMCLSILPRVFRRQKPGWQQALAALSLALFVICLPALAGDCSRTKTGFITGKNIPLRLTPTSESEPAAMMDDGEFAREVRSRGEFILVCTARGTGWVKGDEFGRLCPK